MSESSDNPPIDFSFVLASSVHDMKNSLGMLLTSLEEVVHSTPIEDEQQRKRFGTLQYEASRINTELIQLLSIYRMQTDRLVLNVDENYVIDVLEEQLARNHMLFETRSVRVEMDCDPELAWFFDADLVGGVVHNVLVNCARYTRKALHISASVEDDLLCIAVADDGVGYPDDMLQTGDGERARGFEEGSTHLGLFFARQIAMMHRQGERRGRIELANHGQLGGGLFSLYLP
ncbi:sensor histidine kinase [Exilibacterium tricleocarpae]|uniref:Sensor histidine kinase n=1 Tax=Exilibacterium tricleocarpae TaxID=2591008 RepID=A0A545TM56_9GAMM|nr:ATP-binding protein [Exilibacterium tricleocarpae]TQV78258.1 sensor histidine kinase [Exilibacterium tricleocarpae]